jgi:hypothetical protein
MGSPLRPVELGQSIAQDHELSRTSNSIQSIAS